MSALCFNKQVNFAMQKCMFSNSLLSEKNVNELRFNFRNTAEINTVRQWFKLKYYPSADIKSHACEIALTVLKQSTMGGIFTGANSVIATENYPEEQSIF